MVMFIYAKMPQSISAEAYKSIRTSIRYASVDKIIKTIVVTSSIPGEGKSTIAGNLGLCLSESGNKVLIIDCDLRRPSIHRKFKVSNMKGLTDVLLDKDIMPDVIHEYSPRLSIIPAGTIPPNPSEILGSKTFEKFLREIRLIYDYVILDTPPILAVTDAKLLAGKADATILVVRYGKTKEKFISNSYKELIKVNAKVIGSILNICDTKGRDGYYNYYPKAKGIFKGRGSRKNKSKSVGTNFKNIE